MADASTPPHAFFDSDAASECESSVAGTPTPYARRGRCILADAASEPESLLRKTKGPYMYVYEYRLLLPLASR